MTGLKPCNQDPLTANMLRAGLTNALMVVDGQLFNVDLTAPLITEARRERAQRALTAVRRCAACRWMAANAPTGWTGSTVSPSPPD